MAGAVQDLRDTGLGRNRLAGATMAGEKSEGSSHCRSALEALSRQRIGMAAAYWLDQGGRPLSCAAAGLVGREGTWRWIAWVKDIAVAAVIGQTGVMALQAMPWPARALLSAQLLHLCIAQMPIKNPPVGHTSVVSRASPSATV